MVAARAPGGFDAKPGKERAPVGGRWGLGRGGRKSQELPAPGQGLLLGPVGEKAVVADAPQAAGEHVEKKAADELVGR